MNNFFAIFVLSLPFILATASILDLKANQPNPPQIVEKIAPPQNEVLDISGYYAVKGQIRDKEYSGVVNLIPTHNSAIYLVVSVADKEVAKGIAIYKNKMLSISWVSEGITCGISTLNKENKDFSGIWTTVPGPGELFKENWTFLTK